MISPLQDKVLVRLSEEESPLIQKLKVDKTEAIEGTVIATGYGYKLRNGQVRKPGVTLGERVVFARNAAKYINNTDPLVIVREDDIWGVKLD